VQGYVRGMHAQWLADMASRKLGLRPSAGLVNIETRFRYNPDVKSLVAMVPAMIPLLLMLILSMLTALSVVRDKEMGSIVNLYVTPVTRLEFLLGKQLPYILLAMLNFLVLAALAVTVFGTAVLTILPATQFSGMIDPVSSLEGLGALIGRLYPTTHFLTISRGTFSKALGFADLQPALLALALAVPVLMGLCVALLKKQEA